MTKSSKNLSEDIDLIKEFEELRIKQKLLIETLNKKSKSEENALMIELNSKLDFLVKIFKAAAKESEGESEHIDSKFEEMNSKMDEIVDKLSAKITKLEEKIPSTPKHDSPTPASQNPSNSGPKPPVDISSSSKELPKESEKAPEPPKSEAKITEPPKSEEKVPAPPEAKEETDLPPVPDFGGSAKSPADTPQASTATEAPPKKKGWFK